MVGRFDDREFTSAMLNSEAFRALTREPMVSFDSATREITRRFLDQRASQKTGNGAHNRAYEPERYLLLVCYRSMYCAETHALTLSSSSHTVSYSHHTMWFLKSYVLSWMCKELTSVD